MGGRDMAHTQAHRIAIFGEVLFDVFDDGTQVLGGAPFNVAWHLQAFQQAPLFISRVGCDEQGDAIHRAMRDWGMADRGLQRDERHPTGVVAVTLDAGEPHYAILDEQAYDCIDTPPVIDDGVTLLYHGTLALRHQRSQAALERIKSLKPSILFLDVNLRDPWWQAQDVEHSLSGADWVKLNQDEFERLYAADGTLPERMQACLQHHDLQGLIVTRGEQGACALLANGEWLTVAFETKTEVIDCVGAGDAFAAVLMLGLIEGWPMATMMQRAQDFASALVGCRGATVPDRRFYQDFIEAWGLRPIYRSA